MNESGDSFFGKCIVRGSNFWLHELHSTYQSVEDAKLSKDKKELIRAQKKRHELWMFFRPVRQKAFGGYVSSRVPPFWEDAKEDIIEAYKRIDRGTEYGWESKVA